MIERLALWRRHGGAIAPFAALGAGGVSVFGYAPWHAWGATAAAIVVLALLLDDAAERSMPVRRAFARAWFFAFAAFLAGLNWIGSAFLVDAEKFAALAIPAVVALPAGLALFWGAAGALYVRLRPTGPARVVLLAGLLAAAEMARSHLFTGFPWNLPGYVWAAGGWVSQTASLIGAYGLSVATLLVFSAPAALFGPGSRAARIAIAAMAPALLFLAAGFGMWRLAGAPGPDAARPVVAAVDAGFSQKEMWAGDAEAVVPARYLALMDDPKARGADVLVWPEGAMPFLLLENEPILRAIERRLQGRILAVGAPRRDIRGGLGVSYFNALAVIGENGRGLALLGLYDKHHLVPFGEYTPFGDLLDAVGLRSLVSYGVDFTAGPPPQAMRLTGLPLAGPLICYEAIFPRFFRDADERPQWLLNVSVDGWFGRGAGPYQHYNQARFRAIEEGVPLVRAASRGPSAIVDAFGREVAGIPAGPGVAAAPLPLAVSITPFAAHGESFWVAFTGFLLILGLIARFLSR